MERRGRLLSPGVEAPECWALWGAVSKAHVLGAQDSSADAPATARHSWWKIHQTSLLLSLNFSDSCQPQLEEKPGGSLHSDLFGCACGIFSFIHPGLTYFHSQGAHYLYAFFFFFF